MKVNLTQVLKNHKGQPMKVEEDDATLLLISYSALNNITQQEAGLSGADRLKRGRLAQRLIACTDPVIELKSDEVALIKQCIGMCYSPWVVALTEDMLESGPDLKVVEKG